MSVNMYLKKYTSQKRWKRYCLSTGKKVTTNGERLTNASSQKADSRSFRPMVVHGLFRGWICVSVSQFQPKERGIIEKREPEWGERLCRNHISTPTEVLRTSLKHFLTSSDKPFRSNGLILIFFLNGLLGTQCLSWTDYQGKVVYELILWGLTLSRLRVRNGLNRRVEVKTNRSIVIVCSRLSQHHKTGIGECTKDTNLFPKNGGIRVLSSTLFT